VTVLSGWTGGRRGRGQIGLWSWSWIH